MLIKRRSKSCTN